MKQNDEKLKALANEGLTAMLDAERALAHALRRVQELASFGRTVELGTDERFIEEMKQQYRRIGEEIADVTATMQNILEFRKNKEKEMQRGAFALDNTRLNLAEGIATLNVICDYLRGSIVMSRHSLAETRRSSERGRTGARLWNDLLRELTQSEEQMEQLSHITASLDDLLRKSHGVHSDVFAHSQTSRDAIKAAMTAVEAGRSMMNKVRDRIASLVNRVADISALIDVIDDISEQTNLLALNASIEAARAGEQGKGFAVVADDIRKLAERSSTATRDLDDRMEAIHSETSEAMLAIQEGNDVMDQGVKAAGSADEVLRKTRESIGQLSRQQLGLENELTSAKNLANANLGRTREMVRNIRRISESGGFAQDLATQLEGNLASIVATTTSGLGALQQEIKRMADSIQNIQIAQDTTRQVRDWINSIALTIGDTKADSEVARTSCAAGENQLEMHMEQLRIASSRYQELEDASKQIAAESSRLALAANILMQSALSGAHIQVAAPGQVLELTEAGRFRSVWPKEEAPQSDAVTAQDAVSGPDTLNQAS